MTAADDLIRLVPSLVNDEVLTNWPVLETRLDLELPSDYKWIVDRYGPGKFDNFLHILQPGSPFEPIQLEYSIVRAGQILEQLRRSGEVIPYSTSELLPVATTDNGDTVFWIRRPMKEPDLWTITVNAARNLVWSEFNGGIVEFLVSVLSGDRRVEVFPKGFPSEHPEFSKYVHRRPRRPRP
jgi:hypothetical protein